MKKMKTKKMMTQAAGILLAVVLPVTTVAQQPPQQRNPARTEQVSADRTKRLISIRGPESRNMMDRAQATDADIRDVVQFLRGKGYRPSTTDPTLLYTEDGERLGANQGRDVEVGIWPWEDNNPQTGTAIMFNRDRRGRAARITAIQIDLRGAVSFEYTVRRQHDGRRAFFNSEDAQTKPKAIPVVFQQQDESTQMYIRDEAGNQIPNPNYCCWQVPLYTDPGRYGIPMFIIDANGNTIPNPDYPINGFSGCDALPTFLCAPLPPQVTTRGTLGEYYRCASWGCTLALGGVIFGGGVGLGAACTAVLIGCAIYELDIAWWPPRPGEERR